MFLLSTALAYDSEPQPVHFEDSVDVFSGTQFSTGWVPAGSPLQVQFAIESLGGATVSMDGEGSLTWPAALTLAYAGTEGAGSLILDASIDAVTSLSIDLSDWGYSDTFELDRRSVPIQGDTTFTPFLLGDRVEVTDPGDATTVLTYSYELIPTLSLDFSAALRPEAIVGLEGVAIQADTVPIEHEGAAILVDYAPAAELPVETLYVSGWDTLLNLVLTPQMEVCSDIFGCVTVLAFDIPIELYDTAFTDDFPAVTPVFPLPLLVPGIAEVDFGDVPSGSSATAEVSLRNDGALTLSGEASIEGSTDFTVFPSTFSAGPGLEDGVVVTFVSTAASATEATLVLTSNDPGQPELRIPIVAGDLGSDVAGDDEVIITKPLDGCGCGTGAGVGSLAPLLALLAVRRRR